MIATETYLLVLLIVLEGTEIGISLAEFLPVLSQAESVCSVVRDMEEEDGAIYSCSHHNMLVDTLRDCDRVGSTIKHHEILTIQEAFDVLAYLVFNITEFHFANIRSFG